MRRMSRLTKRMVALYCPTHARRPRTTEPSPPRATEPAMFSRWGAFVYRHRRIVLVLAIVVGIAASTAAGRAASVLSAGGWLDPNSESAAVTDRLADEFGAGRGVADRRLSRTERRHGREGRRVPGRDRRLARGHHQGPRRLAARSATPRPATPRFISNDGHSAYVVVDLNVTDEESVAAARPLRVRAPRARPTGIEMLIGGYAALTRDSTPAVRARPRPGRDDLAADRRASS